MVTVKPYVAMKNSGVEWLGDVPAHWEVRAIKTVLREKDHRSQDGGEPLLSLTRGRGIVSHSEVSTRPAGASDRSGYKLCNPGDLVMNRMQAWSGMFALATLRGLISPDYSVFSPRGGCEVHVAFLENLFKTPVFVDQFAKRSKGIGSGFNRLYTPNFGAVPCVVPPPAEQRAIIRFLDYAGRRIQRSIRAKERLIELLEEQKQAIIHQTVTGQIDVRTGQPYPAYKDSGVEWLGEVPKDWGVVQLGRIATDRCDGPFGSGLKSSHYTDEGVRVVRLQNIGHGVFRHAEPAFVSPEHYSTLGDHSVEVDDVLIAGLGDANHPAGRACVAPGDIGLAMVKADCFRFRLDQSTALPRFVALQLTATARSASGLLSTGATRQRINLRSTAARRIAIPEIEEQSWIVEHITHGSASHVDAQENARRGIELLSEYRTRLIADVVTGKIDVREAAAALPDSDPFATADTQDPTPESQAEPAAVAQGPHP